jgi:exo-1,4-beta-D-glucosaminidase
MKILLTACICLCCFFTLFSQDKLIRLSDGWRMQSSLKLATGGNELSSAGFPVNDWYAVSVPTTILAGLIANKEFDFDPFYGKNFQKITGKRFDKPWWFRKEFTLPAGAAGKNCILKVHGINYKANLWLNGVLIADSNTIKGPFRIFEIDITKSVKLQGNNVLAIEITRPFDPHRKGGDLAIDYADWLHYPADYNGGIVNDISIRTCDKVAVRYPLVTTRFDLPSLAVAHLAIHAEVVNYSNMPQEVEIKAAINDSIQLQQRVRLQPLEVRPVSFKAGDYPLLHIRNPRIWWPWQYGEPALNTIKLEIIRNNAVSSEVEEKFGIRQVQTSFISNDTRQFSINGKPILLRGAAWSPDIFLRRNPERQEDEIKLVRDMNMNLLRCEGKFEDDRFYELCDKYGILVMTGWMCCGAWQYPANWSREERTVAMESAKSMMYWFRNKACMLTWLNGSDRAPSDISVEKDWLKIQADLNYPNPILSTAHANPSKLTGKSGVKMNGPYEWVPPVYWETDPHLYGGAWGFATEISPGPSIPPYESLVKFLPKDSMNNNNSDWNYHCGTMKYGNTLFFNEALSQRYGKASSMQDFAERAQAQNYEAHRAMMEAYGINKYKTATGVVQWMLNNSWPGLIWHTYDYYLYPAGTYYGIKKALEPLHVQYSYKSKEVIVVNSLLKKFSEISVRASVYNLDGELKYTHKVSGAINSDAVQRCFTIPPISGLSDVVLLRLQLDETEGKTSSINWYWLSKKEDRLNWSKSNWYYTPQSAYADFSSLQQMPTTTLSITPTELAVDSVGRYDVAVRNTGNAVAFFVHIRALKAEGGEDILPVFFSDNYFCLAPGESRTISCSYQNRDPTIRKPYIAITAWNTKVNERATNGK